MAAQNDPQQQQPGPPPQAPGRAPFRIDNAIRQDGGDVELDEAVAKLQDRPVRSIQVARSQADGVRLLDSASTDSFVRSLTTRVGQPFAARNVRTDCTNLWNERRMIVRGFVEPIDNEVVVTFLVDREIETYEGVDFVGMTLARTTVDSLLGLTADRRVTRTEAEAMRKVLLARYARDGYAFCSIEMPEQPVDTPPPDAPAGASPPIAKSLLFVVDEGPKVTIGNLGFSGNAAFAASPALGLFGRDDYLVRDSHMRSTSGSPYSRELIEEDLDRLRLFYHSRGFLDATVDLASTVFTPDRTSVDLSFVVVEGPRYRIRSVKVEQVATIGGAPLADPLYPTEEIAKELKVVPGEFYDHQRLQRDMKRIEEYYGRRGHPPSSFPGWSDLPQRTMVLQPSESYTLDQPEVDIVFQVVEGRPKRLRDVVVRGNQFTRDAVIRRRFRVVPGDVLDMKEVERALRGLEQTRYFQDPSTFRGPRLQVEPVAGEDEFVDLGLDVEEGPTSEFRWGVGISTGQGASGQITFNKRNFDIAKLPSSWNPITAIGEILDNRAFHGGGQTLNLLFAPGSRYTQAQITFVEPDVFGQHFDTYELRVAGRRLIRRLRDGYTSDTLGAEVGLSRNFTEQLNVGLSLRDDGVKVKDLASDATSLAFAAEGNNELRGLRLSARYRELDDFRRPTSGYEIGLSGEVVGGFLGGDQELTKLTHTAQIYAPLFEDDEGHFTVLHLEHFLGTAAGFGSSEDVFLTERFYVGGANLRGFDYRGAGPTQFERPIGGEAVYTGTVEVSFPLVASRVGNEVQDRELLRGVVFTDVGLLGLSLSDPTFHQLRASSGFGVRIEIPALELPIRLDLGWPWLYEESDSRRQLYFSIGW